MGNICVTGSSALLDADEDEPHSSSSASRKSSSSSSRKKSSISSNNLKKLKSPPVIVLQANGSVMQICHKVRAGELMKEFPQHFLCHASTILIRRKSKMIPPKSHLQRGNIYLLLPFPNSSAEQQQQQEQPLLSSSDDQEKNPLLGKQQQQQQQPVQGTTKFVISKVYLDKILFSEHKSSNGSGKAKKKRALSSPKKSKSSSKDHAPSLRKSSITWSPALESIPESPLKF